MQLRQTKYYVPRAALADGETLDKIFLIKNSSTLRLTYQIRLLTFRASELKKTLVVDIPSKCKVHPSLYTFVKQFPKAIRIQRA